MSIMRKYLMMSVAGAIGALGILFMFKNMMFRRHHGMYEKAGKGFDEKLRESKMALDKATAHIQNVFEHLKNRTA